MSIFAGPTPKILGATVYALNLTHGLAPAREAGPHEVVVEVINEYSGLIRTDAGNVYANGDFNIVRYAEAAKPARAAVPADPFAATIAGYLEADDYDGLTRVERTYAVLACEQLLAGDVKVARQWARRQKAADHAITELFARRDARKAAAS